MQKSKLNELIQCNLRFVIKRANLKRIPITSWLGLIASILMLIYALRHVL